MCVCLFVSPSYISTINACLCGYLTSSENPVTDSCSSTARHGTARHGTARARGELKKQPSLSPHLRRSGSLFVLRVRPEAAPGLGNTSVNLHNDWVASLREWCFGESTHRPSSHHSHHSHHFFSSAPFFFSFWGVPLRGDVLSVRLSIEPVVC